MLEAGLLDFRGALILKDQAPDSISDALLERLIEVNDRRESYIILARAEEIGGDRDIIFTQQDIREFQLAKGAIRAGEMVLQKYIGLEDDELEQVVLAGAFGTYIDLLNARRVNLVPQIPLDRMRAIGNAAGVGSKLALVSTPERVNAERIGRKTEHIQLSGLDDFQKAFIQAMRFPLYQKSSSRR